MTVKDEVYVGVDTETRGLGGEVYRVGVLTSEGQWYWLSLDEAREDREWEKTIYEADAVVAHNVRYDARVMRRDLDFRFPWDKTHDTMVVAAMCTPGREPKDLLSLSMKYLDYDGKADLDVDKYKEQHGIVSDYSRIPDSIQEPYTQQQLLNTLGLFVKWQKRLPVSYYDFEQGLIPTMMRMEDRGVPIDIEQLIDARLELDEEINSLTQEMFKLADEWDVELPLKYCGLFGVDFNLASGPQLAEVLEAKGYELPTTDAGNLKTDKATLEDICGDDPFVEKVLELREAQKLQSTYIEGLLDSVDEDGCLHPNFASTRTRTGRLSCSRPNCFPGEVEVLTEIGWIKFEDYSSDIKVGSISLPERRLRFVKPTDTVSYTADKLVHLYSDEKRLDILCTPNHRLAYQERKGEEKWKYCRADEIKEDKRIFHSVKYYQGKENSLSNDELRLLIALQADGHRSEHGSWSIRVRKKRKQEAVRGLARKLGLKNIKKYEDRNVVRLHIGCEHQLSKLADTVVTKDRIFTESFILGLTQEQREIFCERIMFWDGCWTRQSHYSTNSYATAKSVQLAFCLTNRTSGIRKYKYGDGGINFQVDTRANPYSMTSNLNKGEVRSKTKVYCVEVPEGNILIRHNDQIAIVGNCQNIAGRSKSAKIVRRAFVPRKGFTVYTLDYSQIEFRLAIFLSEDPVALHEFEQGIDFHIAAASAALGIPIEEVTPKQRQTGKTVNFAIVYGSGASGLSRLLDIPYSEAEDIIDRYAEHYSHMWNFKRKLMYETKKKGYVELPMGRRLIVDEEYAYKAFNYFIQGAASDIIKKAMVEVDSYLSDKRSNMLLQIHDELDIEEHYTEPNLVYDIHEIMTNASDLCPLDVDIEEWQGSWAEKKEIAPF